MLSFTTKSGNLPTLKSPYKLYFSLQDGSYRDTFNFPMDLGFLEFLDRYRFSVDSIQMMRCFPVGSRNSRYTLSSKALGNSISKTNKKPMSISFQNHFRIYVIFFLKQSNTESIITKMKMWYMSVE